MLVGHRHFRHSQREWIMLHCWDTAQLQKKDMNHFARFTKNKVLYKQLWWDYTVGGRFLCDPVEPRLLGAEWLVGTEPIWMFCGKVPVLEPQQNNLLKREKGPRMGFSRPVLALELSDDCKLACCINMFFSIYVLYSSSDGFFLQWVRSQVQHFCPLVW